MVVDGGDGSTCEWEGRWNHIKKFLERSGPFTHPDFEPSAEVIITFPFRTQLIYHLICSIARYMGILYNGFVISYHSHYSLCWKPAKSWSLVLVVWDVSF